MQLNVMITCTLLENAAAAAAALDMGRIPYAVLHIQESAGHLYLERPQMASASTPFVTCNNAIIYTQVYTDVRYYNSQS